MLLSKCPYCKEGMVEVREKNVRGKRVKLYACSNARWKSEDGELWELHDDATCSFRIWQNTLGRYGKWLGYKEIRELLQNGEIEVELLSKKYGKKRAYTKTLVLDPEYGISVLWES